MSVDGGLLSPPGPLRTDSTDSEPMFRIDSGVSLASKGSHSHHYSSPQPLDLSKRDVGPLLDAQSSMASPLSYNSSDITFLAASPTDEAGSSTAADVSVADEAEETGDVLGSMTLSERRSSTCSRPLSVGSVTVRGPRGRARYQTERSGAASQPSAFATDLSSIEFAWDVVENRNVVLKKVADAKMSDNEIDILNLLRTAQVPGVIRLIDSFQDEDDENRTVLVFPRLQKLHMRNCDLIDVARRSYELLTTLSALGELKLAHLDICPANLMVDDSDNLVLIDFGLARLCEDGSPHPYGRGTPGYIAPELYLHAYVPNDCKPDVYSAAIVIGWWLEPYIANCDLNLLGSRLLRHNTTTQIQMKLRSLLDLHEEPLPEIVYQAADLIYQMLHVDPADRISAADAAVHPFVRSVSELFVKGSWTSAADAALLVQRRFTGTDWASWVARPKSSPPSRRMGAVRIIDRTR